MDPRGLVNVLAPEPVTNRQFARGLENILGRPVLLRIPPFVLCAAMGEDADAIVSGDSRLKPEKLQAAGFHFDFSELESSIRHELSL
jgi:NAD dependent epimerase/dehydratase family enzyme